MEERNPPKVEAIGSNPIGNAGMGSCGPSGENELRSLPEKTALALAAGCRLESSKLDSRVRFSVGVRKVARLTRIRLREPS